MPRKVTPKASALGKRGEIKGPSKPMVHLLTLEDRTELRKLFESEVYRKAFSNARMMKPSVFTGGLATTLAGQIASNQICRIQGWEMFEAALAQQVEDPKQLRKEIVETWPDEAEPK